MAYSLDTRTIDLRYENLAWPTDEMWTAMRGVEGHLGMASLREDATTQELEARACEVTGLESALLLTTTTAATAAAFQALDLKGRFAIVEARCHVYWVENHLASYAGATAIPVMGDKYGAMPLDSVAESLQRSCYDVTRDVGVVCLENTHNVCGGTVLTPEYTNAVGDLAHRFGATVYIDGARLFNAAVAQEVPVAELCAGADVVVLTLNKSLGAPFGCLLCGSSDLVRSAEFIAQRMGSIHLHKAGILSAAALVAFDHMPQRMGIDHIRAKQLAQWVQNLPCFDVDLATVQTNLIRVETTPSGLSAREWERILRNHGLAVHILEPNAFKLATYHSLSDDDVEEAKVRFGAAARHVTEGQREGPITAMESQS